MILKESLERIDEKCWRGLILTEEIVSKKKHPFIKVLSAKLLLSSMRWKITSHSRQHLLVELLSYERIFVIIEIGIFLIFYQETFC